MAPCAERTEDSTLCRTPGSGTICRTPENITLSRTVEVFIFLVTNDIVDCEVKLITIYFFKLNKSLTELCMHY